jgi:hypothetical protein
MRTHGKRDANQAAIVAAMRARGWLVLDLASVGGGCPDLLVCRRDPLDLGGGRPSIDVWFLELIEVKSQKGTLTADQKSFIDLGWPVRIVRSVDDLA